MNLSELNSVFPKDRLKTDAESLGVYGRDWTKHFEANASAIVFPENSEEVQSLVKWARKNKVALVPSGGRTGLSAAAYATNKEIVVSFERMNKILDFDSIDQTITCQAGVITASVQNFAKKKGYYYPVDFAARGSSQIGGNVATNAGGIKVIRYGLTRNWVAGLTVVTGRGDLLHLNNSLVKNASGYDLRQLIIGSEGTLGFVTEVVVSVTRPPQAPQVYLFAVNELSAVMEIYKSFRNKVELAAFEMFTDVALK